MIVAYKQKNSDGSKPIAINIKKYVSILGFYFSPVFCNTISTKLLEILKSVACIFSM
jgi:hypothetical protein